MKMFAGIILLIHSAVLIGCTVAGALGYIERKRWRDALGISLTVGIAALCEMQVALNWIF
jgi:hypothetical protein